MIHLGADLEARIRMGEDLPQREQVLVALRDSEGTGVCADWFRANHIPRYSARIGELRGLGWEIPDRRTCENPNHRHRTTQYEWTLGPWADPSLF